MKQQARRPMSTRSFSINNYDTQEVASRFNKTFLKAAEEAREAEMCKKVEEEVTARLTV